VLPSQTFSSCAQHHDGAAAVLLFVVRGEPALVGLKRKERELIGDAEQRQRLGPFGAEPLE
jgi:hypothetical protein